MIAAPRDTADVEDLRVSYVDAGLGEEFEECVAPYARCTDLCCLSEDTVYGTAVAVHAACAGVESTEETP